MSVPERDSGQREPIFNSIPTAVLVLALAIVGAELAKFAVPPLGDLIFQASVLVHAPAGTPAPSQPLGPYWPYLLHFLVHFGWLHIIMNLVVLVSAGRLVARALGDHLFGVSLFLVFFGMCSVLGAITQVVAEGSAGLMLGGASTGVSGLIAAAGWVRGGYKGMLRLTLPWIAVNLLIGVIGIAMPIPIGWAAHIGGAVAGAGLFPVFLRLASGR